MGLRTPLKVLAQNAGDCDSKAALAAAMLVTVGFQSAVVSLVGERHAVLGVVAPPDISGTTVKWENGKRYTLVEVTNPRPIGDVQDIVGTKTRLRVVPVQVDALE